MDPNSSAVLTSALGLPPAEREDLINCLWASLEMESGLLSPDDEAFAAESLKRRTEIQEGKVATISHQELRSQLGR